MDTGDWFAVVTPLDTLVKTPALTISGSILWNRAGTVRRDGDTLILENDARSVAVTASGAMRNDEPVTELDTPYLLVELDGPVCVCSNPGRLAETADIVARNRQRVLSERKALSEVYNAMQICLAWEEFRDRVDF